VKAVKSVTLIELLITVIIIGILATLATINYSYVRENLLDRDVANNLKVIQAAQKAYYVDMGSYYGSATITYINQNLKVLLPTGSDRKWNYQVYNNGACCATRNVTNGKSWYLAIADADGKPDNVANCP